MNGAARVASPYESIETLLGPEARKYAENKQRGGASGKKGCRYEDFFLAAKAGEIAADYFSSKKLDWPILRGQTFGFVDDAVVLAKVNTNYYQLKNVKSITWTSGDHPLGTDFEYQYRLSIHLKEPNPTTILVVPEAQLQELLSGTIPNAIKAHSSVTLFPFCDGHSNRIVQECKELQENLRKVVKVEHATLDELVAAFGVLILACMENPDGCSVDEIVKNANRYFPAQIRTLAEGDDGAKLLAEDFVNTLARIPRLTYDVKRGFFSWSAFGTSGVLGFDCSSDEFKQFQENVVQQQPMTFDQFEALLP